MRARGALIATSARKLDFHDNGVLKELVGEFGSHLRLIEEATGVQLSQRGDAIVVAPGAGDEAAALAERVITGLYALVASGRSLRKKDVEHAIQIFRQNPEAQLDAYFGDVLLSSVAGKPISPRSEGQRRYVAALRTHDIVFGVGPAGTGKTYLATAMAVAALKKGAVRRIILTRPAVEAGEKLGFLPGDMSDKVDPYLRPLYDALEDMLPAERVARMLDRGVLEVAPLAFMRGRTLDHAFVILDEAQNTTRAQMKMFLTRMGADAKMVVTGDPSQVDLPHRSQSGLIEALDVLSDVKGIGVARFDPSDVVRHPLVAAMIRAYATAKRHKDE